MVERWPRAGAERDAVVGHFDVAAVAVVDADVLVGVVSADGGVELGRDGGGREVEGGDGEGVDGVVGGAGAEDEVEDTGGGGKEDEEGGEPGEEDAAAVTAAPGGAAGVGLGAPRVALWRRAKDQVFGHLDHVAPRLRPGLGIDVSGTGYRRAGGFRRRSGDRLRLDRVDAVGHHRLILAGGGSSCTRKEDELRLDGADSKGEEEEQQQITKNLAFTCFKNCVEGDRNK